MKLFGLKCLLEAMRALNANQLSHGRMELNFENMTLLVPAVEGVTFSEKELEGVRQSANKEILPNCRFGDDTHTTLCFSLHRPDNEK